MNLPKATAGLALGCALDGLEAVGHCVFAVGRVVSRGDRCRRGAAAAGRSSR